MIKHEQLRKWALYLLATPAVLLAVGQSVAIAQVTSKPSQPPASTTPMSDQELESTQEQLMQLLRTSPTLTSVVARDPSLLSNQEYVNRNNPQLAQFLEQHPDIARNPEYYLFTRLNFEGGRRSQALERAVWPDLPGPSGPASGSTEFMRDLSPLLAFGFFLAAAYWVLRQLLENRRWSRIFKLQSEVHAKLIERFSSAQELASYMETEAGKRFLEAAPIPIGIENDKRMPNAVARVLTPLQIGVVMVLLGVGFFLLRDVNPDIHIPMLVLGTVALMPGIGFILSAGITWVLAGRLGLIPDSASASEYLATTKNQGRQ